MPQLEKTKKRFDLTRFLGYSFALAALGYVLSFIIWSRLISLAFSDGKMGYYFANPFTPVGRRVHYLACDFYYPLIKLDQLGFRGGPASLPTLILS